MLILRHRLGAALAIVGVLTLGTGCAAQNEQLRRDLADVKHELVSLRAQNLALRERVDGLEASGSPHDDQASDVPEVAESKPEGDEQNDRPRLSVVRVGPEEQANDGWVSIDPSDPKRPRLAAAAPAQDGLPATVIRSDRVGNVVQDPARPPQVAQRK